MEKLTVKLIGTNRNAFAIIGKVNSAMREAGYSKEEISKYNDEAMSGDYDQRIANDYAIR